MSLAEGVAARICYKAYASSAIVAGVAAVSSSALGASSAQVLRRTSSTLALSKSTYQSEEIRSDRQISDFRHGVKRAQGDINGELSPATYWDLFEAVFRGTAAAAVAKSNSELTSVAADNSTSKFTFGGGNPVTEGYRVGDILRFTNLSESANNSTNFVIRSFGGSSNREVTVTPAPTTMTADSAFNVTSVGQTLSIPSSSHVSRKFGFEIYNEDIDTARLFTECRLGGCRMDLPAEGMATCGFTIMGRGMEVYEGGDAPFFTSPTAATSTGIFAAVNGVLMINGSAVGVVTGVEISIDLSPSSDPAVGSTLVPEIFLGRANVTGQVTARS